MTEPRAAAGPAVDLRPLSAADLPRVLEVERACFSTPWSEGTFLGLLGRADTDLIGAVRGETLVGYAVCWTVVDQAELGNIAVAAEARGEGVAKALLHASIERVGARGARELFLEVRESNLPAMTLYLAAGFEAVGRRRRYYSRPVEDAFVMRLALSRSA